MSDQPTTKTKRPGRPKLAEKSVKLTLSVQPALARALEAAARELGVHTPTATVRILEGTLQGQQLDLDLPEQPTLPVPTLSMPVPRFWESNEGGEE